MSDLLATFEINAKQAASHVSTVSLGGLCSAVQDLTRDVNSIVLGFSGFVSRDALDELRHLPGVIPTPSDEQLSSTQVGMSDALAGVAATGSVCIAMGPPLAAAASLLMPLHIVILSADRIVARPRDLFDPAVLDGEGLRRNLVFITGPSATADMGPLVRGVHGPHRLQILVVR